jgi:hypothetical protein
MCCEKRKCFVCASPVGTKAITRCCCSRKQDTFAIPASSKQQAFFSAFSSWSFLTRPFCHGTIVLVSQAKQINNNLGFAVLTCLFIQFVLDID